MPFIELRRDIRKRRRSRKRARNAAVVVVIFAFLGVSGYEATRFALAMSQVPPVVWRKSWGGIERYEPAPDYRAARTMYPYSVVPGGVLSETEIEASIASDPVVARHYRDILPEHLHTTRLNAAVNVYASYRSANSVYWTAHTVHVPKGELLLSDGANLIRARCGNRLAFTRPPSEQSTPPLAPSPIPQSPDPAPIEPPYLVFEHGMPSVLRPPGLPSTPHLEDAPRVEVSHFWPPSTEPPDWCCGPGGFPGIWNQVHPVRPGHPKPKPSAIAEPTTSLLMGTGVFVMLIRMARRPKR